MSDTVQSIKQEDINSAPKHLSKIILFFMVTGLLAIISLTTGYLYYNFELNKAIRIDMDTISITIPKGSGIGEIASQLEKEELLNKPIILKVHMYLNPDKTLQAGFYEIGAENLTLLELIDTFQQGSFERKLTFIEGWRLEQYQAYLEKEMGKEFAADFIQSSYTQEGYMFPDTYIIDMDYAPENMASWMRNNFDARYDQAVEEMSALRRDHPLSREEVIILASIVEREMNISAERAKVAGILIKRLENGWPLQADATIQYAKGTVEDPWPKVTSVDLKELQSPFNTYLNRGLPPAPICNPSLDSIESVLNYQETPYWFYITGKDGITYYAETLEDHNENIRRFL